MSKKPVHEVRSGRVRAAIWENETQNGLRHNVTFSRLYKDGDQWKDSSSFGRDDLPLLIKVADQVSGHVARPAGSCLLKHADRAAELTRRAIAAL